MKSTAEYADVSLSEDVSAGELLDALTRSSESGLVFTDLRRLSSGEPALSKVIHAVELLALLPPEGDMETCLSSYRERYRRVLSLQTIPVTVQRKGKTKTLCLEDVLMDGAVEPSDAFVSSVGIEPGRVVSRLCLRVGGASLRPAEVTKAVFDIELSPGDFTRIHCWTIDDDGKFVDPLELSGDRDACETVPAERT
jgi:hypothetical protein